MKTWQLLVLLVIMISISGYFLRQNNLQMIRLRNAVVQADEQGGDIPGTLKRLNDHVFNHMNTEIVRPVELVNTYNRAAEAAVRAASKPTSNDVYQEATRHCEQQGVMLTTIAQCASDYIMRNRPGNLQREIVLPDKNRFIYTYATPLWTPDIAGISVLMSAILAIWLLSRGLEYIIVRMVIRWQRKRSF